MKRKILHSLAITALSVTLLAGCGKKEVDYSLEGATELGTEEQASTEEEGINDTGLDQFRGEMGWEDEWPVTDAYGKNHNIEIKAAVSIPDLETMRVIESQPLGSDAEFKSQCLDSFFGVDTEYYYHDQEHWTREELEKWLPDETEMIANASDNHMVAGEFESVSEYAGYRDEILYEISLTDTLVSIIPNWDEMRKCAPEQLREYENIDMGGNPIEGDENVCKYSKEEAQTIADAYMKNIGLSGMECTSGNSVTWRGGNGELSGNDEVETVSYGYAFEYATGIDGISFSQFPQLSSFRTEYATNSFLYYDIYCYLPPDSENEGSIGNGKAHIIVTDAGVFQVVIENAEVIEAASNSVGLLPLDTIKAIMQKEVTERTAKYNIRNFNNYNSLQLMYLKVTDDTKERVSAVPVWCLCYKLESTSYIHPVFVNAIDGTIVHFADAEWAGEDAEAM